MGRLVQIRGGRLMDPATGRDEAGDLWILDGRIVAGPPAGREPDEWFEAAGCRVTPPLLDLHVHLREPGGEEAETVESGVRAAAAGGFGTLVAMPNTRPPADTPERIRETLERARRAGAVRVLPAACMTRGRAGREPADLEALAEAGAAAFTDDGSTVADDAVLRAVLERAARLGRVVMDHAQDPEAERSGVLHEGTAARRLGLPAIPSLAEARIVARDIALAAGTGCPLHIQHVSSREGVELLRAARRRGLRVSGELTPHHLALCDEDLPGPDPNWKMNPPLRGPEDRAALREAVCEGLIGCFATDHAPHAARDKALGFRAAPFGVIGLETAVGVTYTGLVAAGRMDPMSWLRRWTTGPAAVLGLPPPTLAPGAPGDAAVFDLETVWRVERFLSRSSNSPFLGCRLRGRCVALYLGGRRVPGPGGRAAPGDPLPLP